MTRDKQKDVEENAHFVSEGRSSLAGLSNQLAPDQLLRHDIGSYPDPSRRLSRTG